MLLTICRQKKKQHMMMTLTSIISPLYAILSLQQQVVKCRKLCIKMFMNSQVWKVSKFQTLSMRSIIYLNIRHRRHHRTMNHLQYQSIQVPVDNYIKTSSNISLKQYSMTDTFKKIVKKMNNIKTNPSLPNLQVQHQRNQPRAHILLLHII